MASNGTKWPFALSPGVWVVHGKNSPLFTTEKHDRGKGLEAQSEDGNPATLAESLKKQPGVKSSGIFNTPVGATAPGPIGPGGAFESTFTAAPGPRLSFAMMFGQSNDLFYASNDTGIALFDKKGKPISGDITPKVSLWDVGTEENEEPGIGPNQAPVSQLQIRAQRRMSLLGLSVRFMTASPIRRHPMSFASLLLRGKTFRAVASRSLIRREIIITR
jgi:hypothetical protein